MLPLSGIHPVVAPSGYSAFETLRDGRSVQIRALRADDRNAMLGAVGRMGQQSRYFRFFGPKKAFTEREIAYFTDLDFVSHVALVAELTEQGRQLIVGGARYIVTRPGHAEIALGVDDAHHGLGVASLLVGHLISIARTAGIAELEAEVLPGNAPMLRVFRRLGSAVTIASQADVVHVSIRC